MKVIFRRNLFPDVPQRFFIFRCLIIRVILNRFLNWILVFFVKFTFIPFGLTSLENKLGTIDLTFHNVPTQFVLENFSGSWVRCVLHQNAAVFWKDCVAAQD